MTFIFLVDLNMCVKCASCASWMEQFQFTSTAEQKRARKRNEDSLNDWNVHNCEHHITITGRSFDEAFVEASTLYLRSMALVKEWCDLTMSPERQERKTKKKHTHETHGIEKGLNMHSNKFIICSVYCLDFFFQLRIDWQGYGWWWCCWLW